MSRRLGHRLAPLGDPIENASSWLVVIKSCPAEWRELASLAFLASKVVNHADRRKADDLDFFSSEAARSSDPLPKKRRVSDPAPDANLPFACDVCGERFRTNKAALQHARVRHNRRNFYEQFVGNDPVCPVCSKNFYSIFQVVAHLGEKRVRSTNNATKNADALSGRAC